MTEIDAVCDCKQNQSKTMWEVVVQVFVERKAGVSQLLEISHHFAFILEAARRPAVNKVHVKMINHPVDCH